MKRLLIIISALLILSCNKIDKDDNTPKHPNAEYIGYWEMVEATYEGTHVECGQIITTSTGSRTAPTTFNLELKDSTEFSYRHYLCRYPTDTLTKWWLDNSNTYLGLRMVLESTNINMGDTYKFKYVSECIYLSTWDLNGADRLIMKFQRR